MRKPCERCPWGGGKGVLAPTERVKGALAVIGEGPAREELAQGRYFAGPSGGELDKTLAHARVARSEISIGNAFECWKPDSASPREEARAVEACSDRLSQFLEEVQPCGIVMLGGKAMRAMAPGFVQNASSDGLMRHRGSLWSREEIIAANQARSGFPGSWIPESVKLVVATIHPAAIIRRARLERFPAMGYRAVPAVDIRRLAEGVRDGRRLADVDIVLRVPDVGYAEAVVFDLETSQERKPEWIGVQSLDGGPVYAGPFDEFREWTRRTMRDPGVLKVGHNIGGFDIPVLLGEGMEVVEPLVDTMALGGLCEPDMARGLYFQASYYWGHKRPFWKELGDEDALKKMALQAAWRATSVVKASTDEEWACVYNALDVDSTRLVAQAQLARANMEGWL